MSCTQTIVVCVLSDWVAKFSLAHNYVHVLEGYCSLLFLKHIFGYSVTVFQSHKMLRKHSFFSLALKEFCQNWLSIIYWMEFTRKAFELRIGGGIINTNLTYIISERMLVFLFTLVLICFSDFVPFVCC